MNSSDVGGSNKQPWQSFNTEPLQWVMRKMEGCDGQSRGCTVHSTMNSRKGWPSLHPVLEQVHRRTHKAQLERAQRRPEFRL